MTEKMKTIIIERNDLLKILSEDRARQASSGSNLNKYYIALTKGCIMLNAKQMLHDWENEKE